MTDRLVPILLVDDETDALELQAEILDNPSYALTLAHNGRDALFQLTAATTAGTPYTVVVTDMHMPEVDGLTVLAAAHALPHPPSVILVTGDTSLATIAPVRRSNPFAFLIKPYTPTELRTAVAHAVVYQAAREKF